MTDNLGAKIVILLSGGMDSTTLLYKAKDEGFSVHAIAFDYGQKHIRELAAAGNVAKACPADSFTLINLTSVHDAFLNRAESSQTNPDFAVPHGHYADDNMKITIVPNRNMMMLAIAASYAITIKARTIGYAAHAGDHAIYPDCRTNFINSMRVALGLCHQLALNDDSINLYTPFEKMWKHEIVREGILLDVPYRLTWSCYEGEMDHCGLCGTCVERKEAFELAGFKDPTRYAVNDLVGLPDTEGNTIRR